MPKEDLSIKPGFGLILQKDSEDLLRYTDGTPVEKNLRLNRNETQFENKLRKAWEKRQKAKKK